uniref:Uncharacterized protein n=1 Tax=Pararge aegeria TaxID=116150 RepID=S4PR41_9NEOP
MCIITSVTISTRRRTRTRSSPAPSDVPHYADTPALSSPSTSIYTSYSYSDKLNHCTTTPLRRTGWRRATPREHAHLTTKLNYVFYCY